MSAIPAFSRTKAEIKAVSEDIAKWENCSNDFAAGVNQLPPALKRIPADVLQLMSPREAEQAAVHVDDTTVSVVTRRQNEAVIFTLERDAWHKATNEFMVAADSQVEAEKARLATDIRRAEEERKFSTASPLSRNEADPEALANCKSIEFVKFQDKC